MKKFTVCVLSAVVAMAAASHAEAAIVMSGQSTPATIGDSWVWTLNFESTEGLVGGLAGGFADNVAFNGGIRQQLAAGMGTPTRDFNAFIDPSIDSQFLVTNAGIQSAVAPFETATTLGGAFTIVAANRVANMDLVQVAAPIGTTVPFNLVIPEIVGATAPEFAFTGELIGIPEPATFAMAGMGLVGMIAVARRRK